MLRRITQEQPVRPRAVNPAVPRDLETIVLKAIAREPAHRYASAEDLADDLLAFRKTAPSVPAGWAWRNDCGGGRAAIGRWPA